MTLSVALLMRAPQERSYSIEAVFGTVVAHLPKEIGARVVTSAYQSQGLLPRLKAIWHARQATRGADVIHVSGDTHFLTLLLPGRRTILTVHDCEFIDRARGLKRFILWFFWLRLPVWRVAAITAVSEESRAQLLRWINIDPSRVEVIENPLSKPLVRDDRPFSADRPRLLMIGSGPHKNIERVAMAVTGLHVVLEVIGCIDTDRLSRLRAGGLTVETCHDLSDDELAQAYARADIVMFPSLSEGFGLPILEAQAVGRTVVTSNRAPMSGVAGGGALLVNPEDMAEIRTAVERLMAEPELRARLVEIGFENMKQYTPAAAAERYAALWQRVAKAA